MPDISIQAQIQCVERELRMRLRVYPHWVADGRMRRTTAEREIARMEAVLATLRSLGQQEVLL
jgi:hypothetical protein